MPVYESPEEQHEVVAGVVVAKALSELSLSTDFGWLAAIRCNYIHVHIHNIYVYIYIYICIWLTLAQLCYDHLNGDHQYVVPYERQESLETLAFSFYLNVEPHNHNMLQALVFRLFLVSTRLLYSCFMFIIVVIIVYIYIYTYVYSTLKQTSAIFCKLSVVFLHFKIEV